MPGPAERFVSAIAARDEAGLRAVFADDIDFRGLTPRKFWEATTPDEVREIVLGNWFEETDKIQAVTSLERGDDVGDIHQVGYRFEVACPDGPYVVEQQAYYRAENDKLSYMRVVCSGYQPRS
jgi:ketosteroid isomerase-like protein